MKKKKRCALFWINLLIFCLHNTRSEVCKFKIQCPRNARMAEVIQSIGDMKTLAVRTCNPNLKSAKTAITLAITDAKNALNSYCSTIYGRQEPCKHNAEDGASRRRQLQNFTMTAEQMYIQLSNRINVLEKVKQFVCVQEHCTNYFPNNSTQKIQNLVAKLQNARCKLNKFPTGILDTLTAPSNSTSILDASTTVAEELSYTRIILENILSSLVLLGVVFG